jgi:dTDP-4-dehydrorhamnose reductase
VRVAVTGATGRLGSALIDARGDAPFTGLGGPIAWRRPDFDLDQPDAFAALIARDRPEVIVHAAAWTDVDGAAREPALAMARNGEATGALARAASEAGVDLVVISTNEVFDGRRTDERAYATTDEPNPANPYGASKLEGERQASEAYGGGTGLGIVRTAWLFGPPGNDFPAKILVAAERARLAGEPLKLVRDERGTPTYTVDLADAIVGLIGSGEMDGLHHVVNAGVTSRADWAREVLRQAGVSVETRDVPMSEWQRPSTPPAWAALEPTPRPSGEPARSWQEALADYLPLLHRRGAAAT